jgi:hypothetical protein
MAYMSKIVDSMGGRRAGIGEVNEGSRNRGHIESSVKGKHLRREKDTKWPQQPLWQS